MGERATTWKQREAFQQRYARSARRHEQHAERIALRRKQVTEPESDAVSLPKAEPPPLRNMDSELVFALKGSDSKIIEDCDALGVNSAPKVRASTKAISIAAAQRLQPNAKNISLVPVDASRKELITMLPYDVVLGRHALGPYQDPRPDLEQSVQTIETAQVEFPNFARMQKARIRLCRRFAIAGWVKIFTDADRALLLSCIYRFRVGAAGYRFEHHLSSQVARFSYLATEDMIQQYTGLARQFCRNTFATACGTLSLYLVRWHVGQRKNMAKLLHQWLRKIELEQGQKLRLRLGFIDEAQHRMIRFIDEAQHRMIRNMVEKMIRRGSTESVKTWKHNLKVYQFQQRGVRALARVFNRMRSRCISDAIIEFEENYMKNKSFLKVMKRIGYRMTRARLSATLCTIRRNQTEHMKEMQGQRLMKRFVLRMQNFQLASNITEWRKNNKNDQLSLWENRFNSYKHENDLLSMQLSLTNQSNAEKTMRTVAKRFLNMKICSCLFNWHQSARTDRVCKRVGKRLLKRELTIALTEWHTQYLEDKAQRRAERICQRVGRRWIKRNLSIAVVEWHAQYAEDKSQQRAQRIIKRVSVRMKHKDTSLSFQEWVNNFKNEYSTLYKNRALRFGAKLLKAAASNMSRALTKVLVANIYEAIQSWRKRTTWSRLRQPLILSVILNSHNSQKWVLAQAFFCMKEGAAMHLLTQVMYHHNQKEAGVNKKVAKEISHAHKLSAQRQHRASAKWLRHTMWHIMEKILFREARGGIERWKSATSDTEFPELGLPSMPKMPEIPNPFG